MRPLRRLSRRILADPGEGQLIEIFFAIITQQAIQRGTFDSVRELTAAIRRFIDRCQPFT